jgi:FkbM family methyltransferase
MKEAEDDARFFSHLRSVLLYHQRLLRDEVRNRLFYEALQKHITSETRVLDIGAGSGVWAITAAKLGAKKVVAIESDSAMIPVLMNHIRENGVGDKVEIVHGLSQDINLRHKFEVVISETIGNSAFEEHIAPIMIDARKRFLARGGVVIRCRSCISRNRNGNCTRRSVQVGISAKAFAQFNLACD